MANRFYNTVQGDMWDTIALRQLGSEFNMSDIIKLNRQYVDIGVFPANIRLVLPDVEPIIPDHVPPWKRQVI